MSMTGLAGFRFNAWFADYGNVVMLAEFLVHCKDYNAEELFSFVEKPWKYEDEWTEFQTAQRQSMMGGIEVIQDGQVVQPVTFCEHGNDVSDGFCGYCELVEAGPSQPE